MKKLDGYSDPMTGGSSLRRTALRLLRTRQMQPVWEVLHRASIIGQNYWSSMVSETGELIAMEWLAKRIPEGGVVFDVGANQGQYAVAVASALRPRSIYSFEPSAATFELLQAELHRSGLGSVVTAEPIALGDTEGTAVLNTSHAGAPTASLHNLRNPVTPFVENLQERVRTSTVDTFAANRKLNRINLLKIDVEGHELAVLRGASGMLSEGRIDYIQFEFGEANIDSRTYYRDFHDLLSRDFVIYRIVSNGLRAQGDYHPSREVFATINYLAARREQ